MLKVMAKMGISTLHSYKGAQIFEAIGLQDEVVELCFEGTASRVQGVNLSMLAEEMFRRHALGFPVREEDKIETLPNPGEFHWRAEGEKHMWNPNSISALQVATRTNNFDTYKIAKMKDIPEIEITLVESDINSKAVDFGVFPVAPALTNAIYAATGKRIRNLPIGKQKLI